MNQHIPEVLETGSSTMRGASFVSGGGTTAEALARVAKEGVLGDFQTVVFVASKGDIGAIKKAEALGIPVEIVDPKDPADMIRLIVKHKVDIVMQNGWIPKTPSEVIEYMKKKRIRRLNQHPGDLRKDGLDFGGNEKGKGMYGSRVTAAKILYMLATHLTGDDVFVSASVHMLSSEIDRGDLFEAEKMVFTKEMDSFRASFFASLEKMGPTQIMAYLQRIIASEEGEELYSKKQELMKYIETIQKSLLNVEHKVVQNAVKRIVELKGKLPVHPHYTESLIPEENAHILDWAKKTAVTLYPKG